MPETADQLRQTAELAEGADAIEAVRDAARATTRSRAALAASINALSPAALQPGLAAVAAAIPVAASVELAMIRVADDAGALHLLAVEGVPDDSVRRRALTPIPVDQARRLVADNGSVPAGSELGITWGEFVWIGDASDPRGTLTVACRTRRRPSERDQRLIQRVAAALGLKLEHADRRAQTLSRAARILAAKPRGETAGATPLESLSPRETTILKLYAEQMSTAQVAELLFISPATVRTHVRNALRRLGVHTRAEAVALVIATMNNHLF